ncbi:hypothetical protein [Leptothermofonsia sp. ETS-13]
MTVEELEQVVPQHTVGIADIQQFLAESAQQQQQFNQQIQQQMA